MPNDPKEIDFSPKSSAMKEWKRKYYDKEEPTAATVTKSSGEEVVVSVNDVFAKNITHKKFVLTLIALAFGGGYFARLGVKFGPRECSPDGLFEILGGLMFWASVIGLGVNLVILLASLAKDDFKTKTVLLWTVLHIISLILSFAIFAEFLLDDLFCNGGHNFYVTASPI